MPHNTNTANVPTHNPYSPLDQSAMQPSTNGMTNGHSSSFNVTAPNAPVTYSRIQSVTADDRIEKPSIARANAAVSSDKPSGEPDYVEKYKDYVRPSSSPPPPCNLPIRKAAVQDANTQERVVRPPAARPVLGPR